MPEHSKEHFLLLLVGFLLLTSCAQHAPATPSPPTAVPLPTAIPDAVAVEIGSVGKGTPMDGAWSPDGSRLAIASTQRIIIYSRPDWKVENFISLAAQVGEDVDLEFLADGTSLLFRGDGSRNTLYEINLQNNEITELPFRSHTSSRTQLAFSPDGKLIASYRTQRQYSKSEEKFTNLEIIDKESGKTIHSFSSPIDKLSAIKSVKFSPDSKWLATAGDDNHVRLYDVASGEIRLDGSHDSDVNSVDFSLDGRILVSAGDDAVIRFWDVETSKNLYTMKDFTKTIAFAGYFSHGEEFIIRLYDGSYQKWDVDDEKLPLHRMDFDPSPVAGGNTRISSDGEVLFSIQNEKVKVWDLKTGGEEITLPEYNTTFDDMEFSADGKYLAAVESSSNVVIWETSTGKYVTRLEMKDSYNSDISFHPANNRLAVSNLDNLIQVWDIFHNEVTARYQIEDDCSIRSIQYSPDGSLMAAYADKCGMYIWDTSTGKLRRRMESGPRIMLKPSIWFDMKRNEVFAADASGHSVSSWDLIAGTHLRDVKLSDGSTLPNIDPGHNRVYERVFNEDSKNITAWDAVTGEKVVETAQQNCSYTQAIDQTGTLLANYLNNAITFYHLGSMQTLTSVDSDNPARMVFSPDKRFMAAETTASRTIFIFNIESVYERAVLIKNATPPAPVPVPTATPITAPTVFPEDITELTPVELPVTSPSAITKDRVKEITSLGTFGLGSVNKVVWSPDSRYFALIGNRNILIYETDTAKPLQIISTETWPSAVIFSPNNKYLAINSTEVLTLRDVQTGQVLHEWKEYQSPNPFYQIAFSPDNRYLLVRKIDSSKNHTSRSDITLDVETGRYVETKPIPDDDADLDGITLSPDGSFGITISNQAIHVVDPSTRAIRYTLERPGNTSGAIQNWALSPLGKLMIRYPSLSENTKQKSIIEMWNVSIDSPPSLLWSGETGPIYMDEGRPFGYPYYDFSPDGKLLAASDMEYNVHVWDAVSGKLLNQMERAGKISFSPDNASILLIDNLGSVSIWNIHADLSFSKKTEIEGFGTSSMYSCEFFSGDQLVTISNQKISTWDISNTRKFRDPKKTQILENTKSGILAVSANNLLATSQEHGKISIYEASTGSLIKNLSQNDEKNDIYFGTIAISHDGKTVVSTRYTNSDGKSKLIVWDVSSGTVMKEIPFPSFNITQIFFSSNDRRFLGVSSPGNNIHGSELAMWDVETGELLRYYSGLGAMISFHPSGTILASIQNDGTLSSLDLNTGKVLWQGQSAKNARDLAYSPDGRILAVLTRDAMEFWDTSMHEKLSEFPIEAGKISFSSDGRYISLGFEDGITQVLGLKN